MKLNLGCGAKKLEGYVNVDNSLYFSPDDVVDLNQHWPWHDNSIDEVIACHIFEHLRMAPLEVMLNLYRVMKPGAKATITLPHPRSDAFMNDPTHRHAWMPAMFEFFSKKINDDWQQKGFTNTPVSLMYGIDFTIENVHMVITPAWYSRVGDDHAKVAEAVQMFNNVISEFTMTLTKEAHCAESSSSIN